MARRDDHNPYSPPQAPVADVGPARRALPWRWLLAAGISAIGTFLFLNSAIVTARLASIPGRDAAFHADWVYSQVALFGVCLFAFVFSVVRFFKLKRSR
jgi:hypothetical protein